LLGAGIFRNMYARRTNFENQTHSIKNTAVDKMLMLFDASKHALNRYFKATRSNIDAVQMMVQTGKLGNGVFHCVQGIAQIS
jgi:hypothetical protein